MASVADNRHKHLLNILSVRKFITIDCILEEQDLISCKWFDYRFMSAYDATILFASIYAKKYQQVFGRNFDVKKAKNVHGIHINQLFHDRKETTQLWLARQRADRTGMPYGLYIELSLEFALRRQRKTIPRPNQLHHSNCADKWHDYMTENWQAYLDGMKPVATHPAYQVENYRGLKPQDDYRRFILDRVSASLKPLSWAMESYCDELRQIGLESLREICTPERYEKALEELEFERKVVGRVRSVTPNAPLVDVWPSCFGLSPIAADDSHACSSCNVAAICGKMGNLATKMLVETEGSATPVSDRVRGLARERQRRCRAMKSAAIHP